MKLFITTIALCASIKLQAQHLQYTGKSFFALSVSHTDSTSKWYEDVFTMKLLKEIKVPDENVHIRIIGNEFLKIEIIQNKNSKSITDCGLKRDQVFLLQGFFKTGFYVADISAAEKYFRTKKVSIKHGPFTDEETHTRSIIIEDINGFLIHLLQELK